MKRIMVIGCSGSGKSTLSRKLGEKLNIPVVHLDRLWWNPGWVESSREEFDAKLAEELSKEKWIIDGNFSRTLPRRLQRCDAVIYLDFNRFVCLWGMFQRVIGNYGRVRPDMGDGCPERFDPEFIKWIWGFNKNNRKQTYRLLNEVTHTRVIILKNRRAVNRFLEECG